MINPSTDCFRLSLIHLSLQCNRSEKIPVQEGKIWSIQGLKPSHRRTSLFTRNVSPCWRIPGMTAPKQELPVWPAEVRPTLPPGGGQQPAHPRSLVSAGPSAPHQSMSEKTQKHVYQPNIYMSEKIKFILKMTPTEKLILRRCGS